MWIGDVDIKKMLVSDKIFLVKKTISTVLITYIIVIKLKHHTKYFQKQALM